MRLTIKDLKIYPACKNWLNFCIRSQFEIKILLVRLIIRFISCKLKKNWTWACAHLKTNNLSAHNFIKTRKLGEDTPNIKRLGSKMHFTKTLSFLNLLVLYTVVCTIQPQSICECWLFHQVHDWLYQCHYELDDFR